eukprot:scaffold113453_cov64-Phaeocystis_antarctica.AAC.2
MAVAVARKLSSSTTSLLPKLAWKSLACLAETGRGSSRCLSLDAAKAPGWILDIGRSNRHAAERKAVEAAESQILCRLYEAGTYTGGINQPTLSVARFVIGDEKKSTIELRTGVDDLGIGVRHEVVQLHTVDGALGVRATHPFGSLVFGVGVAPVLSRTARHVTALLLLCSPAHRPPCVACSWVAGEFPSGRGTKVREGGQKRDVAVKVIAAGLEPSR